MSINYTVIGANIRKARKKIGFTQEQLAEEINKSSCYISYIENGKKHLSLETLVDISNVLCVSSEALLSINIKHSNDGMSDIGSIIEKCSTYKQSAILEIVKILVLTLKDNP